MSEYPLSTKSSKKSKKPELFKSPALLERSACQAGRAQLLRPEDYGHILAGERVFIEMYYQGRVVETEYNEYIKFMGGELLKRLTPKVSIFLTNIDQRELAPIRERVRKICPHCRIVNILWFEQCYQEKQKVPFGAFALDVDHPLPPRERQEREAIDLKLLEELVVNVGEDLDHEFRQFFQHNNKYFETLPKNHSKANQEVLPAQDIDLGPHPEREKKVRPKGEKKRGKSLSRKTVGEVKAEKEGLRELKSTGSSIKETHQQEKQKQEGTAKQPTPSINKPKQFFSLENLMSKYLGENEQNNIEDDQKSLTASNKSKHPHLPEKVNSTSKTVPSQHLSNPKNLHMVPSKHSLHSANTSYEQPKPNPHRFTFSTYPTKYKDLTQRNDPFDPAQLAQCLLLLGQRNQNSLLVVTPSRALEKSINQVNLEADHHSSIRLLSLPYRLFPALAEQSPQDIEAYFLLNPRKMSERALYFGLLLEKVKLRLTMVSHRLIDEVMAYNRQVKGAHLRSPIKLEKSRLKFLRQLKLTIQGGLLEGKRVAFLQSEVPCPLQKQIVEAMGGEFVPKEDYLLSGDLNLIITDRLGIKEKGIETITQEIFWRKVLRLEGETG